MQYKTYMESQSSNDRYHGFIELARSWDKFFKSMQRMRLLSIALLVKTIPELFLDLSDGFIFRLVHNHQVFRHGHMLELTCKIIHLLSVGLFVQNLQSTSVFFN